MGRANMMLHCSIEAIERWELIDAAWNNHRVIAQSFNPQAKNQDSTGRMPFRDTAGYSLGANNVMHHWHSSSRYDSLKQTIRELQLRSNGSTGDCLPIGIVQYTEQRDVVQPVCSA